MTSTQTFWRGPSGRVHSLQRCTAAARVQLMRKVQLTHEQFEALRPWGPPDAERCRCATWREDPTAEVFRSIAASVPRALRPVGPCPCECSRGGFCGGCGHAGCGGRR